MAKQYRLVLEEVDNDDVEILATYPISGSKRWKVDVTLMMDIKAMLDIHMR